MTPKLWVYLCIITVNIIKTSGDPDDSKFLCTPESVKVYNLPENYSYTAMQDNGNYTLCNVTKINSTLRIITGCSTRLPMLLVYGVLGRLSAAKIHTGKFESIRIICKGLPDSGVVIRIGNTLSVSRVDRIQKIIKPTFNVKSSLNTTSAVVGDPVAWTISYPAEYILEVSTCGASPGSDAPATEVIQLISRGGCQVMKELINSFKDNMDGSATAVIRAFKFFSADSVVLKCDILICPNSTTNTCNTKCSRLKRSVHYYRETGESYSAKIQNVIEIVNPYSNGVAKRAVSMTVITPMLTFLVLHFFSTHLLLWH